MPGKRSRASRNTRPLRTRPVAASTRSGLGAAAVAAGVPWVTMPRSAPSWASARSTFGAASARARAWSGAIRVSEWRSLAAALSA